MDTIALLLAAVALVIALLALSRSGRGASTADTERELRRVTSNLEATLRSELDLTRRLLAEHVRGVPLTAEAVLDGQLWRDVDGAEAARLLKEGTVVVVDVRTPGETRLGHLPGARLIPLDELEGRRDEVPRSGAVLIYCAMGGRSAAACEGLSREGWSGLMNLTGGIAAWEGPLERP